MGGRNVMNNIRFIEEVKSAVSGTKYDYPKMKKKKKNKHEKTNTYLRNS